MNEKQTLWLHDRRVVTTMFCRLIGVDYEADFGQRAVLELGAITNLVQGILGAHEGTLTRIISDDKGTSMLLAFQDAGSAVAAAMDIELNVRMLPNLNPSEKGSAAGSAEGGYRVARPNVTASWSLLALPLLTPSSNATAWLLSRR